MINSDSNCFKLGSFKIYFDLLLVLNILTKFSACLTDNFLSIIFLATKKAFSNPTKTFACPCDKLPFSIKAITSLGNVSKRKQLEI